MTRMFLIVLLVLPLLLASLGCGSYHKPSYVIEVWQRGEPQAIGHKGGRISYVQVTLLDDQTYVARTTWASITMFRVTQQQGRWKRVGTELLIEDDDHALIPITGEGGAWPGLTRVYASPAMVSSFRRQSMLTPRNDWADRALHSHSGRRAASRGQASVFELDETTRR